MRLLLSFLSLIAGAAGTAGKLYPMLLDTSAQTPFSEPAGSNQPKWSLDKQVSPPKKWISQIITIVDEMGEGSNNF